MSASGRLLTAADVLAHGSPRGELWDGVFVVREPSGGWAGAVEFRVAALLAEAGVSRVGWAFGASQGYLVSRDPDRVLSPDVSFVLRERLPAPPADGFIEGPPDLAVEVRSPRDTWLSTIEKGGVWIGHGARVVWCIDPRARTVVVQRPGREMEQLGPGARLGLQPLLDREVAVAPLFEGLE